MWFRTDSIFYISLVIKNFYYPNTKCRQKTSGILTGRSFIKGVWGKRKKEKVSIGGVGNSQTWPHYVNNVDSLVVTV